MPAKTTSLLSVLLLSASIAAPVFAQRSVAGATEARLALDKLTHTGSVLMIAAHPDDENTALLAWLARGRKVRTGYLSLTRGEGGQNLIGAEQGAEMGVIRTEELLAARRIDGAEQFFSRAIDFGFSKTASETLEKWGRETVLSDVVWVIRNFRPDVIVLRFSGTPRDGHGQHQASAILGKEAFEAAADPKRFPEQLKFVQPWRAKRVMFNTFAFTPAQEKEAAAIPNRLRVDTGEYDPTLGFSYSEIAGMSRSMHRSQGMGAAERKGPQPNFLVNVAGDAAKDDLFDGVDITWTRLSGGDAIAKLLLDAAAAYQPSNPDKTISLLLEARPKIAAINDPIAKRKLAEVDEALALCSGLWVDAAASNYAVVTGAAVDLTLTALNRSRTPIVLEGATLEGVPGAPAWTTSKELAYNQPATTKLSVNVPADQPYTQPFWLAEPSNGLIYSIKDQQKIGVAQNPAAMTAVFRAKYGSQSIELRRPVIHRYVDHVIGELTRPLTFVPPVSVRVPQSNMVFTSSAGRSVEIEVRSNRPNVQGDLRLKLPQGWTTSTDSRTFSMAEAGELRTLTFDIKPSSTSGDLRAVATVSGREVSEGITVIDHPHFAPQNLIYAAKSSLVRADVKVLARNIGYIMGAGDQVPESLKQMGCTITFLTPEDLARGDLSRYDAIVAGVRAYNVRKDLRASQKRLMDYVSAGGTYVVQYNVLEGGFGGGDPRLLDNIGPYPITFSRDRITVEDAPIKFEAAHPVLSAPNKINATDFEGWVQERGLYFATKWDEHYQTLFTSHDPGEADMAGGTLVTPFGKGYFVWSGYAWFRQLPAGNPGAYRIFANFISAGKTAK